MDRSALKGAALMLLAMGLFVSNDTLMKGTLARVPIMEAIAIRGAFSVLFGVVVLLLIWNMRWRGGRMQPVLWWRGLAEFFATLTFVIALANLPMADVTAIGMTAPLFLIVGLRFYAGIRPGGVAYAAVLVGFLGALLVAKPGFDGLSVFAALAFVDAMMVAWRDILGRDIEPTTSPFLVSTTTGIVLTALALMGAVVQPFIVPLWSDVLAIAGAGLLFFLAQSAIFLAYQTGPASVVALFYYAALIWAILFGWSIFGEKPDLASLVGITLVAASGIANVIWQNRRLKAEAPAAPR